MRIIISGGIVRSRPSRRSHREPPWSSSVSTARRDNSSRRATVADVLALDPGKVNPVTGPIHIDGAEPGDAVKVRIEHFAPSGFGWTANIPGFGLLADQFREAALHLWKYDPDTLQPALFSPVGRVPLKPFAGTIGLAPAEPGRHSVVPPRRVGQGNRI